MVTSLETASWLNEPSEWRLSGDSLTVTTDNKTDFWRETFYGFTRDTGHFLGVTTTEPFTAQVRVRGGFRNLYDQAGLMVRIDENRWVKAGVEFTDGQLFLSTVVTNGKSDWSVSRPISSDHFLIRITLVGGAMRIQASTEGVTWPLLRLAPFQRAKTYLVGPMTCSPEGSGLKTQFTEFSIRPPQTNGLHNLS
ncbi:DUF1349 domain-containing protein [Rhizobium sp.]|uniref:DUF1349 domain-containing protein n=1 Tax=Rhizobium sp. TaxID=391 RepID=UPI0028AC9133